MRSLKTATLAALTSTAVLLAAAGCSDLHSVTNPNNPDVNRVLASAGDVVSLGGSNLSSWYLTTQHMDAGGPLNTMADAFTASWNNYYMRLYSSEPRTNWRNDLSSVERTAVEQYWYSYYAILSSANDVVRATNNDALRWTDAFLTAHPELTDDQRSAAIAQRKEALALGRLMQGVALGEISINYDKGFYVDENSDLTSLVFTPRTALRDSAVKILSAAVTALHDADFNTSAGWTGGPTYSSSQLAQVAATEAARVIAYHPRNRAELDAITPAQWQQVADFAAQGVDFDFNFHSDGGCPDFSVPLSKCDFIRAWGEDPTSMRVDMRVAHLMDPNLPSRYPGDAAAGALQPNSPDKRLGDGSYGTGGDFGTNSGVAATARAGTDFVFQKTAIFREERGLYHRSNIAHLRYRECGGSPPPNHTAGVCDAPIMSGIENDLLHAEADIHLGKLPEAATLINNTRVVRGGLPPATAAEGAGALDPSFDHIGTGLYGKLQYEQEVELLGIGSVPYYNRRKIDGLQPRTPHEFPVPAKELGVLGLPFYTYGGDFPLNSSPTATASSVMMSASAISSIVHPAKVHHSTASSHF